MSANMICVIQKGVLLKTLMSIYTLDTFVAESSWRFLSK